MKRVLCLTLCLLLVFGCFTPAAYAADIEPDTQVLAQPGDVQIEATNRIGSLLSAEITEVEQDSESSGLTAFVITDLTVDENTAVVSYSAEDYATVVVALYSEDGLRMLTSASGEASPDASEITVTFSGEMPEYFLARAYMLALDDCTPLSDVYETPIYTQSMQELLDSTIDDYDPELVVNFDDDPNTNFAVYNEGVVIVDEVAGVNIVTTNDDENLLYVIENADDTFTTLQEGDIVSYFYGEDQLLLCKVSSLSVDGTNVTIHGADDMMIDDVFSHFKLESDSDAGDFVVEDTNPDDGIDVGAPTSAAPYDTVSINSEDKEITFKIPIAIKDKPWKSKDGRKETNAYGHIDITIKLKVDFYIAPGNSFFREKFDYTFAAGFHAEGEVEIPLVDFSKFTDNKIAVVGITMNPEFVIQISGQFDASAKITGTFGFNAGTGRDPINLTTIPKLTIAAELEAEIYIGWDLGIKAFILKQDVLNATLSIPIGGTAKVALCGKIHEDAFDGYMPDSIHECNLCLDGSVYFEINVEIKFEILKHDDLSAKIKIPVFKSNETKFFYSFDFEDGGTGKCPYELFLAVIETVCEQENDGVKEYVPVSNVTIHACDLQLTTNEEGIAYGYLPEGNCPIRVKYQGIDDTFNIRIQDTRHKVKIILGELGISFEYFIEENTADDIVDDTLIIDQGTCGDNLFWILNSSGVLTISGTGDMDSYNSEKNVPWYDYRSQIHRIVLEDGLTSIGNRAFYQCYLVTEMYIPDGVTVIGESAFARCENLIKVRLPDGLTTIGENAFWRCHCLADINLPESVTEIWDGAFVNCVDLTSIDIPAGVSVIRDSVFFNTGLIAVTIPDTIISIGSDSFGSCFSLTEVEIADSVTFIDSGAFSDCDMLASIDLPDNLEVISSSMFSRCYSLEHVVLPSNVERIEDTAFWACEKLPRIEFPESLVYLGEDSFSNCIELREIIFYGNCPDTQQKSAFTGVYAMGYYPPDNATWTAEKMSKMGNNIHWTPYSGEIDPLILAYDDLYNGVSWILYRTGELFIYGEGPMSLYVWSNDAQNLVYKNPWEGYIEEINKVTIDNGVTSVDEKAFKEFTNLQTVHFPESLKSIHMYAFYGCSGLQDIYFSGNAPTSIGLGWNDIKPFAGVTANAYYPSDDDTWTSTVMSRCGDTLNWIPYTPNEDNSVSAVVSTDDSITLDATFGGAYNGEDMGDYIQRTASFSSLIPGAQYVMLSMVNIDTAEPVAPENLLYIDQAEAGEDGTLRFTYVQRVTTDPSYVVLCGPATKSLVDADITVPDYYSDGELHVVNPTLLYDGDTLIEGQDYEISGQVCFDECGTYTCFIRGIHNYTGTLQCVYTVGEWNCSENGHEFEDGFCRYCGEEDPDYEPTDPTEPVDPTDPTDPTVPEDPTDPIDPTEPEDPTEPSDGAVIRLAGSNRYLTGFAVADQLKRNMGVDQFEAVVVAYGQNFPDALTGSYLAAVKGAPILLTEPSADADLLDYLKNNLTSGGMVYILGGTAAVSQAFEDGAGSLGFAVKRLKGAGRYETNLAILREAGVNREDEVLIATGKNYADSLSASATGLPMLLVDAELTQAQKEFLESTSGKFVIIGGTGAVSGAVEAQLDAIGDVVRVKGANRYGTSVEIAKRYFTSPESVVLAYAQGFPDGLCGGPLALSMGAPLILTSNENAAVADDYVVGIYRGVVTGGTGRISDDTVRAIFDLNSDTPIAKP